MGEARSEINPYVPGEPYETHANAAGVMNYCQALREARDLIQVEPKWVQDGNPEEVIGDGFTESIE